MFGIVSFLLYVAMFVFPMLLVLTLWSAGSWVVKLVLMLTTVIVAWGAMKLLLGIVEVRRF
jgi:hypothetical protein